jgi:hypothetical protein
MRVFLLLFLFISAFCSPRGPQNSASGSRVDSGGPTSFRYTIHNYQTPRYEQLTLTLVSTSSALHCYLFCASLKGRLLKKKNHHTARPTFELHFSPSFIAFAFLVSFVCRTKDGLCCVVSVTHCVNFSILCALAPHAFSFNFTSFENRIYTPSHGLLSKCHKQFIIYYCIH